MNKYQLVSEALSAIEEDWKKNVADNMKNKKWGRDIAVGTGIGAAIGAGVGGIAYKYQLNKQMKQKGLDPKNPKDADKIKALKKTLRKQWAIKAATTTGVGAAAGAVH